MSEQNERVFGFEKLEVYQRSVEFVVAALSCQLDVAGTSAVVLQAYTLRVLVCCHAARPSGFDGRRVSR